MCSSVQVAAGELGPSLKHVCVGSEWYRFPSAFFLPSDSYRLAFVDFGFQGMLPTEFNTTAVRIPPPLSRGPVLLMPQSPGPSGCQP